MPKANPITELSEILATALADRPDLNERLSTLLGRREKPAVPGKEEVKMTKAERKKKIRTMFNRLSLRQKLLTKSS